jgi:glutamate-ammonia-ligase adenylyltransferase
MAIMSFGKLGGREIAFGSDLDLIFVSQGDVQIEQTRTAEKLLRMLISYTRDGIAYSVDTRLRPEGSKGPLVSSVEAFRKYYAESAAFWEFQALLKARPVAGDMKTGRAFMQMAHETLTADASKITASDIRQMRERIMRERAKEADGYDIKLGPGGIEEIEFMVQFLQMKNCARHKTLFVQNTLAAIRRLANAGIIAYAEAKMVTDAYLFFRAIEILLRLKGEGVLKKDEAGLKSASEFMGMKNSAILSDQLENKRTDIKKLSGKYLRDA